MQRSFKVWVCVDVKLGAHTVTKRVQVVLDRSTDRFEARERCEQIRTDNPKLPVIGEYVERDYL